jgi:hypothetical protein
VIAFQTPALLYYLDQEERAPDDIRAPDRPSENHEWLDGTGWIVPADILARIVATKVNNALNTSPLLFELVDQETLQPPPMTRAQLLALLVAIQQAI